MTLPARLQATYADGYLVLEDGASTGAFSAEADYFSDLINRRHEPDHGPLVRLDLVTPFMTHSIDWTVLPAGARPVRVKTIEISMTETGLQDAQCTSVEFGFEVATDTGVVRDVIEVR